MLKLKPEVISKESARMEGNLFISRMKIAEIQSVDIIKNFAIEKRNLEFTYGFEMKFENQSALDAYYNHPVHIELSKYLRGILESPQKDLLVLDYEKN
jgi:hypothetical protein